MPPSASNSPLVPAARLKETAGLGGWLTADLGRAHGAFTPAFWLGGFAYSAVFLAVGWAVVALEPSARFGIPWNPLPGVALAFLLRTPPVYGVWIFPAALLTDLLVRGWDASWQSTVLAILIFSGGYIAAAAVLRHVLDLDPALSRLRDVIALIGTSIAASLMVTGLAIAALMAGTANDAETPVRILYAWLGHAVGIAVVAPLLLRWSQPRAVRWPKWSLLAWIEVIAQAGSILLFVWIVFGSPEARPPRFSHMLFLPVLWIAVRRGLDGATIAVITMQLVSMAFIQIGGYSTEVLTDFQIRMFSLAFTGLLIGAVISEWERAQAALRESEARLRERQSELAHFARTSVVGQMTSSLAHELSQPLSATAIYISACRRLLGAANVDMARIRDAIAKAEAQARRAGNILSGLRNLLYRGETHFAAESASVILESVHTLALPDAERTGVVIEVSDLSAGVRVLVDRIQIEQALLNLIRNAMDAMGEIPQAERRLQLTARQAGDMVQFIVADTGPGVHGDIAERLFEPFITTKGQGMGLGLAISRSIAEAHGGQLWLHPGSGRGAEFRLSLPRMEGE